MKIREKSDALKFMEEVCGGPLTFSTMIKATRQCEEMTQEQFAKLLGISKSHLCDILKKAERLFLQRELTASLQFLATQKHYTFTYLCKLCLMPLELTWKSRFLEIFPF